jgi:hypothetical protein
LYRFLKQRGLSERQLLAPQTHNKFEAELSNQIWQADMLFGPWIRRPSAGRMQVFLHATLDDASRLIPHAQFYASQGSMLRSIVCDTPSPPAACPAAIPLNPRMPKSRLACSRARYLPIYVTWDPRSRWRFQRPTLHGPFLIQHEGKTGFR